MPDPLSQDILGAEIQYFRLDPKYWETIIKRFVDTGLRCITAYVPWSAHLVGDPNRKHPAGVLDFEGKTNERLNLLKFLDLIARHGLDLNFRCGPFCCNEMVHGGLPHWLVLGDPNIMVWDSQNRTTQGYWIARREGSQPSYLHPTYLDWCRKWFAQVDPIIRPRLKSAGGFISMINLDNEVSYNVKDGFLDSDYNPVNVAPGGFYHQFLTEKYRKASNLPYGQKYTRIDQVLPPRSVPATIDSNLAWYTDWVEFKTWTMCRYIESLRRIHEANGVKDVIFMTNINPHLPEGIPTRMPAFEKATGPNGIVGYDFYRGAFMSYSGYHSMARILKLMNASLRYTFSPEFMSGLWNLDMAKTSRISDDHMKFMARCALSQGCKSIDWFMFHDRDCWGDTPVSSHGHPRPSINVLSDTRKLLFEKMEDWDALVPQMDVGIIYDLIQHVHCSIGDPSPCNDNALHIGKPSIDGVAAGMASREYIGLHRLVEQAGYQAGVIDVMHAPSRLDRYPLVFLPGSPVIEDSAAREIGRYVRSGGNLIVTGPWPGRNQNGKAMKFLGLSTPPKSKRMKLGKGTVIWHKPFIAQSEVEHEDPDSLNLVHSWLRAFMPAPAVSMEVTQPVSWIDWVEGGGHGEYVQPRCLGSAILHRSASEAILFALNHYICAAEFKVTFADDSAVALEDLDTGDRHSARRGSFMLSLDRKSASVFRVIRRGKSLNSRK